MHHLKRTTALVPRIVENCSISGFRQRVLASVLTFGLLGASALAVPPDLTNGGVPGDSRQTNLGPTGLAGWMYHEADPKALISDSNYTGQSRQILVKQVDVGSPAATAGLLIDDVILGASGDGSVPVDFTSDARKSLALAIAAAEARTTPELKLKIWRAGVTSTFTLTLQNLGAYGPDAPVSDAKCALIVENARQFMLANSNFGGFGFGTLALMALDDPAHPNHAAIKSKIDAEIQALLPVGGLLNGDESAWQCGHTLITLAEYYLIYGEHPSGGVLQAIEAYAGEITEGQSIFGTFGHIFANFRWPDDAATPMMGGYGAINSSAVPGLYGLLLAKQCNISNTKLDECINRGLTFFGSYAGRGAIPYGEHEPMSDGFSSNGKSGSAALLFGLATGKQQESAYFTKMSAASFSEYETGHTGCYFNNLWTPLGAAQGGDDAIKSFFAHTSWLYDLARKWDGSFAYNMIYGANNYSGFNSSVPCILTYALPLKRLHMTGRGRSAAGVLNAAERAQAVSSGMYDETTRTKSELIADLGDWSAVVHTRAANALALMTLDTTDLNTLHALASDPQGSSREGALMALGKIANPSSAPVLSAILSDSDPHVRRLAAMALLVNPAKAAELNTVMIATAAAQRPTFPMEARDPLHHDLHAMARLLFSSDGNPALCGILYNSSLLKVVLTGVDRQLLYPAIRAIATCPVGAGRSTLGPVFSVLDKADVEALGDTILDTAYYRSPADPMFADDARKTAMDAMARNRFAEAIPVAKRSIAADPNNANRPLYGEMFKDLQGFAGTNLLVTPDPEIVRFCQDFYADNCVDAFSGDNALEAALAIDAIHADFNPAAPIYFKSFDWVVADAAALTLPANQTQLHASVTDFAKGDLSYSWSKVYGSGNVTFGSANSKDTTVTFDGTPGPYLFEVAVIDARGFSEIKKTVAVTLYDAGGTLPSNAPPAAIPQSVTAAPATPTALTLSGSDPENMPLAITLTSLPIHGTLTGTAPDLIYLSETNYHGGSDSFTFKVTDSFGQTSSATVSITVDSSLLVSHVHEPFDYPVGALLAGNAGGTGMTGTWLDGPNAGKAWIYDASTVTTPIVTGSGTYSWDGIVDNLPTHAEAGTKMVGLGANTGGDSYEIHRPLAQSAGTMAGADGVLWASIAYHRQANSFAQHLGLALSTDCFTNAGRSLSISGGHGSNLGNGIGVARPTDVTSSYCAAIFNGGSPIASTTATTFDSGDFVMVVKFEFGATDKVSAYAFREDEYVTEALFNSRCISASAAIDESALNRITVACGRGDPSFDEIRVGDSFAAVAGLSESAVDVTPPTPDPMTFSVAPTANGVSVSMTATTATDPNGVEYYFTCTSGGGHDSGWQDSPAYIDNNLETSTQYTYTVKARDKSTNRNMTTPSAPASVTTPADVATVYEPFNYPVGQLVGLNGGNGFASGWQNSNGTGSAGYVYDETANVTFDGNTQNWNGVLSNGFPSSPGTGARYLGAEAYSTSNIDVKRTLASSAGAMAGPDGVLWMSAVYHYPNSGSGAGINIGLTGGGYITDRGRKMSATTTDFIGVNGWNGSTAWNAQANPTIVDSTTSTLTVWNQYVRTPGGVNLNSATADKIIVMKFTFGASDKVEAFWFDENTQMASITESAFNAGKVGATYAAGIDENNLDTLVYSQGRFNNAVDEIRIGNSFEEVIGLAGGQTDATPPTLTSSDILDDQGGMPVVVGSVVNYDISFSEDMNASTINPSDFGNAGTASGTIGTVIALSPTTYRVRFNTLSTGTLQLRVNAGAVMTDLAGNQLNTSSAILDDTTISVVSSNSAPAWAGNPVNETNAAENLTYSSTLADDASDANNDQMTFAKVSGPAWLSVASNGDLGGTPTNSDLGANVFTVSVTDGIAAPVEATLNITVLNTNDAPVFAADPINGGNATEDSAYIGTIADSVSDADGDTLTYAKVSGPAWLTVAANGDLGGTPANGDVGANVFTVSVTDGIIATPVEATLNITVLNTNDSPVFAADPINGGNATEDSAYTGTIAGSAGDADGDTLTYAKMSGPAWLTVAANGTLGGTPANGDVGANVFTVSVTDGIIATPVEATLNITVINTNDAPVFAADPINGGNATEDAAYTGTIAGSANDDDSDTLSYAKVSGPAWLTVAANGDLGGTPTNGDVGANVFTVSVTDGIIATPVEATLNITVINTNDAPVFAADPINGGNATEDAAYTGTIAGSAGDDDGDTLSYAKVSGPAWLTVAANGDLSGTPTNSDVGANTFTVSVSDGIIATPVEATLNITVLNTNDAPVFAADPINGSDATEDSAYVATIAGSASDVDAGATLAYAKVSGPAWLSVASNGALSGTPTNSDVGANVFTVSVTDGIAAPVSATLNITVINTNDAPIWSSDPIAGANATEDSPYSGTLAGLTTDVDAGATLTYSKVSGPAWLTVAANGDLGGTPASGDVGANVFTVSVTDGIIATPVLATLNITVVPAPPVTGTLTDGGTTGLKTASNLNYFNVSFYPGSQGYSTAAGDGSINVGFIGTVVDYGFYKATTGVPYATDAGSSRVGNFTTPDGTITEGPYIWTTTNPAGGAGTQNIYQGAARSTSDSGTVDLTGFSDTYSSGSLYLFHGMFPNNSVYDNVTVTISDAQNVLTPLVLTSASTQAKSGEPRFYVTRFDFASIAGYENLTYTHNTYNASTHAAAQGYFAGVVLTQTVTGDTTPPSLATADIVDDQTGGPVTVNTPVTYTLTFSEDIDDATVTAADFGNAGTAPVTIGTVTETSPGVFTVQATPTAAGTLQLQVNAGAVLTDVAGNALDTAAAIADDTVISVVTPNSAPVWAGDPVNEVDATEDSAYASSLADDASDANSDTLTYSKVSGPAWLTVAANGDLGGTPTNGDVGANVFTVSVTDGIIATPVEATLNITVLNTNDAPVFAADPINGSDATEDAAYTGTIAGSASDDDGDTLTYAKVSGPAWLSVAANGDLSGTPTNGDVGANVFTVSVTDGAAAAVTATLSITVINTNDAPTWNSNPISGVNATEDSAYSGSIASSAADVDTDASLVFAKVSGPAWLSVGANGALSGMPDNGDVGANVFTVSVSDGIAPAVQATVNITVINTNDPPTWATNPVAGADATEDAAYVGSIAASASDVDLGATLTYAKVSGPAWLIVASNGSLSGTPANSDVGANSFTVSVSDGIAVAVNATLNITVTNTNDAPTWTSNPITGANATEDAAYSGSIAGSASDADAGATLTFAKVSGPAWLNLASNGVLSGTPTNSDVGVNSFTVSVSDGIATAVQATLNITVANTNDAPTWTNNPVVAADANEGVAYTGQTLADKATDADTSDSVTYSKVSGPAWLSVATDGTLSGTPGTGTAGLNSFVVRATDTNSATADATLEITVGGLPLPWVASDTGTGMLAGSTTHNAGTFTQAGSGIIGSTSDKLRFTYQTLSGDGEIIAKISALQNTGSSSRVGVMIRDTLATNSKQIFMGMTSSGAYRWVRRTTIGGSSSSTNSSTGTVPNTWVRLVRSGTTITAYKSTNGTSWTSVGSTTNTTFASTCYIGLAVGSGSDTTLNTSQFSNVSVTP